MLSKAIKILLALLVLILVFLFFSRIAEADDPTPPALPVFYYGNVTVDSEPAGTDAVIYVKKLADNTEFGSFSPSEAGKYFYEMACSGMVGEGLFFEINDYIAGETTCPDVNSVASVILNLVLVPGERMANQWVSSTTFPSTLAPDAVAKVNFTPTASGTDKQVTIGAGGLLIKREATDPNYRFEINFPAGTVITGSSTWDGSIIAPTVKLNGTVTVPNEPDKTSNVLETIEVGFSGVKLFFDQPVSILMPGQTGRRVGYSINGGDFTEITNVCPLNDGASLAGGATECKFDNGADLIIWTTHFTYFLTYVQNSVPRSAGYGGGITYSPLILDKTEENAATSTATTTPETAKTEEESKEPEEEKNGTVLGEKIYKDGSLISGSDRKIYYIENQKRRWVVNLIALRKFKGKKVNIVTDFTIYAYPAGEPIFGYSEGDLIRGKDKKIYHIEKGQKVYVKNLSELRKKFFGKPIINI